MNIHQINHQQMLKGVRSNFLRYLYRQIRWEERLIGISGSRGVGKTTLLLQRINLVFGSADNALYISLDSILFEQEKMYTVAIQFYRDGGRHLFLDNIHHYVTWASEITQLLQECPELYVIFTFSSLLPTEKVIKEFKNQVTCYRLTTMSLREYLSFECILDMSPVSLEDLLANHAEIAININEQLVVPPIFRNYLDHGCYPFYWDDPDAFPFHLHDHVRDTIERDLSTLYPAEFTTLREIKRLAMLISTQRPSAFNLGYSAIQLELKPAEARRYFNYLKEAGYVRLYESKEKTTQRMYLGNTNLLAAFGADMNDRVWFGETFFVDQLSNFATVELLENNDFLINDTYTFMVGDALMDYDRIRDVKHAFAAIHGQPKSHHNKLPIWLFGLCY